MGAGSFDDDGSMRPLAPLRGTGAGAPGRAEGRSSFGFRDWTLSILVALAQLAPIRTGQVDDSLAPTWAQSVVPVLAVGSGLALLWRRTHPRVVAAVVLAGYAGLGLIEGAVPPYAAWVVIWSLATSGNDGRRSVILAATSAATTIALLVVAELTSPGAGAAGLLVAVTTVVVLAAVLVRSERARVEAVGRRATTEERLRIARDLHDLVGHGLSAIAVQSSTARVALDAGDAATASGALSAVETTSRVAMREMRQMLGVLMDPEAEASTARSAGVTLPSPGMQDIAALVENVRAGGVVVTVAQTGRWDTASPAVQLCAYRVVQEGLTNAVKHAPGALVAIRLEASAAEGRLAVETSGATPATGPTPGGGRGLEGLRTRVAALSGDFSSGPTPDGWLIEARLPLSEGAT